MLVQQAAELWQEGLKHWEGQLLLRQGPQGVLGHMLRTKIPLAGLPNAQLMGKFLILCVRAISDQ